MRFNQVIDGSFLVFLMVRRISVLRPQGSGGHELKGHVGVWEVDNDTCLPFLDHLLDQTPRQTESKRWVLSLLELRCLTVRTSSLVPQLHFPTQPQPVHTEPAPVILGAGWSTGSPKKEQRGDLAPHTQFPPRNLTVGGIRPPPGDQCCASSERSFTLRETSPVGSKYLPSLSAPKRTHVYIFLYFK